MDANGEGYNDRERSPVDTRRRSRSRSPAPRTSRYRSRTRSISPGADRRRSTGGAGGSSRRRSRSRTPPGGGYGRRRGDSRSPPRRSRADDDAAYPHSSTRGGASSSYSTRGGPPGGRGRDGPGMRESRGAPYGGRNAPDVNQGRAAEREAAAKEAIKSSIKENRVYVGNLSFQVRWHDLKEFCSSIGTVVFAEIITLPNGMSKGCGVVEYSTREEAMRAISELNEGQLFGRPVFLREDREEEARYGNAAVSARGSFPGSTIQASHGGGHGHHAPRPGPPLAVPAVFAPPGPRGLFVSGMSSNIGWQDLKDLFRAAGNVVRADINMDHVTGESKGTGTVVMSSKTEASTAISMFDGYEFDGGRLEVREDRFFHINNARGGHGGPGGRGRGGFPRGGGRGGFGSGSNADPYAASRDTENLYGDYSGPDAGPGGFRGGRGGGRGGFGGGPGRGGFGGPGGPPGGERNAPPYDAPPSLQIFVKNLPWSTSNEDLVELFQTTGTVQEAEVLWENGRSKGNGVVQFSTLEEAENAIAKFQGYQYGGRPLGLAYNARFKDFSVGRNGGSVAGSGDGTMLPPGGDGMMAGDAMAEVDQAGDAGQPMMDAA